MTSLIWGVVWLCVAVVAGCNPKPAPIAARPSQADTTTPPMPTDFVPPADSLRTVAVPDDPSVRYYRNLIGMVFDDSASGATVNAVLRKYQATVVGGFPNVGTRGAYIVQVPDTVTTYEGLQSLITQIGSDAGVDFAFGSTWRDKIVFRDRYPDSHQPARWPRLTELPRLDPTKLVTLANSNVQLFRTEVMIVFEPGVTDSRKQSILASLGLTVLGVTPSKTFFVRFADRGPSIEAYEAFTDSLRARPGIRNVAPISFTPLEEYAPLLPDPNQVVIVRGRVVDADSRTPVPHARVDVPGLSAPVAVDSSGRFKAGVPRSQGCVRLEVRGLGYHRTERTVDLVSGQSIELGDIPLRGAAVPEGATLLIMSCRPAPGPSNAPWGIDTVRVN